MNIQEFLQSGLLEAYALDQCSDSEKQLVESMLQQHEAARTELDAIEQALEQYAMAQAVPAPPSVRENILKEVGGNPAAAPAPGPQPGSAPGISLRIFQALTLVGVLAAAWLFSQNNTLQATVKEQASNIAELEKNLKACSDRQELTREVYAQLRDSDTRRVPMTTNGKGEGYVYHNPLRKSVLVDLGSLPVPDAGKYLQLWGIVDGKTVPIGMIDVRSATSWQSFDVPDNIAGYGVSLEDKPEGSTDFPRIVLMLGNII
jgi:hypothetical protein